MDIPQAKVGRSSDQFPLRLPEGMRDRLKAAATANNRTMNAEIVDRLEYTLPGGTLDQEWARLFSEKASLEHRLKEAHAEVARASGALAEEQGRRIRAEANAEGFHNTMIVVTGQREDLAGRLEAAETELRETKKARDEAVASATLHSDLFDLMSSMAHKLTGDGREEEKQVEAVARFLEGDAYSMEADLADDGPGFSTPNPGHLESYTAKRILEASDRRASAMARLIAKAAPGPSTFDLRRRVRALSLVHSGTESQEARWIAKRFLDESMPTDAAEFREYVVDYLGADAPEDLQAAYREGMESVLPKLFPRSHGGTIK